MKEYLNTFLPDLEEFCDKTMAFSRGEMTVPEYKGFSGGFGSYAQRGGKEHMLRLRMAGGRLTKERLAFVADACDRYGIDRIKMTTCQSLQLHNLKAKDLCDLIEEAWNAGMISRGGGGDFPRNVMASPLSGVMQGEPFDVMPYAEAMGRYLMQFIKAVKFPRKLKVCFSNSTENETHATFRDLGFVAREDGLFDVYAAGGLGNRPALGVKVAEAVEPQKVLYYAKAMVDTFVAHGNYENRGRARTRFMQETLGREGFAAAYREKLAAVFAAGEDLDIAVEFPQIEKMTTRDILVHKRVTPQKQGGLYAVFYQPVGGNLAPEKVHELYDTICDMKHVEIRLTPDEGMYIINLNSKEARKVLSVTEDGARDLFETSVACIGNAICQVGVGDSQEILERCVEAVRRENFADGVLPKIHISGCPSSCGTHQIGEIGFRGAVKQTPEGPKKAFAVFTGGCAGQGRETLADTGESMILEDIPRFLVELGRMIAAEDTTYALWIPDNKERLDDLIRKYTA
jgi:ferredoxin-nitrite reductase